MTYQLKKGVESFDIVDGPEAGRRFVRGQAYREVPAAVRDKFEVIKAPKKAEQPARPVKV